MIKFLEKEFPYEDLNKVGLTREMIDDLPSKVINDLKEGLLSPLILLEVKVKENETAFFSARFSFQRLPSGKVAAIFYPKLKRLRSKKLTFTDKEREDLLAGKTLILPGDDEKGPFAFERRKGKFPTEKDVDCYIQTDPFTGTIIALPKALIERNLSILENDLYLTTLEKDALRRGQLIKVMDSLDIYTIGVDLTQKDGIRIEKGDEASWYTARSRVEGIPKYNYGINGCWIKGIRGQIDYVSEESYTEEMWKTMESINRARINEENKLL